MVQKCWVRISLQKISTNIFFYKNLQCYFGVFLYLFLTNLFVKTFLAELRIHLPTSNPEKSPLHRKARRNNDFSNCLIFIESKNIKSILAKSSDGQDIPVEVGKRNNQTLILLPNQLFGKVESVNLLLEMENSTVVDRFMWNPEDTYSFPQTCPYCKEISYHFHTIYDAVFLEGSKLLGR